MTRFVVGYLGLLQQGLRLAAQGCEIAIAILDPEWNTEYFQPVEPAIEDGPGWEWNRVF